MLMLNDTGDPDGEVARSVARQVAAQAAAYPFEGKDDPRQAEHELGRLAYRWVLAILQQMGVLQEPGEAYEPGRLEQLVGVAPKYYKYFSALIRKLENEGLVTVDESGLVTATARVSGGALGAVEEEVAAFAASFTERYPACAGLLRFMSRCLSRFDDIITGRVDVADILFQDGDMDVFAEVFRGDAVSDYFNHLVAEAVRSSVERRGGGRVIEIGAGTGGTTVAILAALEPLAGRAELTFSDISQSFLRYARKRFGPRYPWLDYRTLNIEKDLSAQGFEAHGFDVVVAANVLHDTRDIEVTLEQTRRLLKPGGLLVLNEFTAVKDCLFFSGALLHGYWLFEDPGRRLADSCLLSVPQWKAVLERTGFALVEAFALPTQSPDAECSQSVMLCEASSSAGAAAADAKSSLIGQHIEQDILTLLGEERSSGYSARRPLMEMGLDSIELVELKSLVRGRFGVKLPPAFLFEHTTQAKIAEALLPLISEERLQELMPREPAGEVPRAQAPGLPAAEGAIAIVGIACRFAGGAVSPQAFWALLERGGHGIAPLPPGRWQWPDFVDVVGKHRGIDQGGFLERIDDFDARFFRISPKEAELMDPQQRLLLELSWEAMEDAGHRPSELAGRKVGVFVGACQSDYRDVLVAACDAAEGYVGSGSAFAMLSNRLSYFYDLKGPSLTVDTACSSSLFALHDAVGALRRGVCEQALVGAVNLLCSPTISVSYYAAGMLSPTGRCRTFDAAADGYVRGEGGAMLLLKPLARALADGDSIYGLVRGTAVGHGGQATTLTAPKPDAQAEVVETAWRDSGLPAGTAGYIEAHGTGTPLGDPIEISGLTEAFRRLDRTETKSWPAGPLCGLGSVKSNLGHLEGAAGLAGVIKILLAMAHRQIPRTLHFERLNPEIDLAGGPFHIVQRNESWPSFRDAQGRELPRRAGVSSFGFGGANAHAVLEEHVEERVEDKAEGPFLVPLSARTQEELTGRVRGLLGFLERFERGGTSDGGSFGRVVETLRSLLTSRFGLLEEPALDLDWEELGWGPAESLLFLAAVEGALGLRLGSRALIAHPSLGALAEHGARELGGEPGGEMDGAGSGPGASPVELADIAWTLQVGREPMPERAAFLAATRQELAAALRRFIAGDPAAPGCYRGFARPPQDRDAGPPAGAGLATLASLWVQGVDLDWERLAAARRRRLHLPAYPFTRERYWVSGRSGRLPARGGKPAPHPLLSQRSSLPEHRFETVLHGGEPFLADHVIAGRPLLPAVASLEMARAAAERLAAFAPAEAVWLRHVSWLRPLPCDESPTRVSLRLTGEEDGGGWSFEVYSGTDAAGKEPVFHVQGRVGTGAAGPAPVLDVAALRARCTRARFTADDCYRAFAAMGYAYGPALQALDELFVGDGEILARLRMPASQVAAGEPMVLHPAMADAAIQATFGFALVERPDGGGAARPALPFEVDRVEIRRACSPVMWASIVRTGGPDGGTAAGTCDIDLCDEAGHLCARFQGLTLRVPSLPAGEAPAGEALLMPLWEPLPAGSGEGSGLAAGGPVMIIGGTEEQRAALLSHQPQARPAALAPGDGIDGLRATIESWGEVGHAVWIVPPHHPASPDDESILTAQEEGVRFGFRLIKAFLAAGYGDRPLAWTVITSGTLAVQAGEPASPTHAAVHGLIGSLAKEQPAWAVRLLDLPAAGAWPWREILAAAADPQGNAAAWRDGRWYRQRLVPYRPSGEAAEVYRPGGVYVVIGGAGGIGEAWSEAVLRRGPAQIVWIGRRPLDGAVQAKLDRLAALGPAPLYLAADAAERRQLVEACAEVRRRFGRIDGVIHASVVLKDRILQNMTEGELAAALAPKIDVCVRLAQAFAGEPPGFVLFFSSMFALLKPPGQSNYVAGCAFEDAFAHRLAADWPCRVRVINWGYWGSLGVASSERHRVLMARQGFGSIEMPEAMEVLDRLLAGPAGQLMYLKTTGPAVLDGLGAQPGEWVTHQEESLPSLLGPPPVPWLAGGEEWRPAPAWAQASREIEASLAELLATQLLELGITPRRNGSLGEQKRRAGILDRFDRWLERSAEELERVADRLPASSAAAWQAWDRRKGAWLADPGWQAQVRLAEAALRALPEVLTGRRAATDVLLGDLLGDASSSLIAEVYRQGPLTRFCNQAVAQAAAAFAVERLRRDPGCRLRFLELGAGTGGTAEAVLAALEARGVPVEEYLFTDLSKTFLTFARTVLPHQPAWLSFATFDVEAPPESQGIAADRYDLVLATNVLQATRDLRATLRHAKAALRTNGLLVLNETSHNSLFHHLTFGLLDGWWLYTDPELRAPGGPALLPETWGKVLAQEGFRATVFPAEAVHPWGQQILLAESDGFVRRTRAARAVMPRPLPVATEEPAAVRRPPAQALDRSAAAVAEAMGRPREEALGYLLALFRLMAAETLGIDPETIGSRSRPFTDTLLGELGMDSLSSNSLRNALRRDLGVDLAVHRIISEKVGSLLAELYEQLLLKHVSHAPHGGDAEETETFVF